LKLNRKKKKKIGDGLDCTFFIYYLYFPFLCHLIRLSPVLFEGLTAAEEPFKIQKSDEKEQKKLEKKRKASAKKIKLSEDSESSKIEQQQQKQKQQQKQQKEKEFNNNENKNFKSEIDDSSNITTTHNDEKLLNQKKNDGSGN
jgi:biopolymer transport protein ExbB/TolQ